MTKFRLPRLESVVWASIPDANGFHKLRPGVVVTATAEITLGKIVRVVAVTTRLPETLPNDHIVLPWDPHGTARSGLRRKCAAVASWLMEVLVDDLQVVGELPPAVIDNLLAKVAAFIPEPPAPPTPAGRRG